MASATTIEVYILVDACGDVAFASDEATARENYENDIGPLSDTDGFRIVKVSVNVPLPELIELSAIDAPELSAPTAG